MRLTIILALLTAVAAEPIMMLVHRWIFHGPLWCWHRSHHEFPSARRLVKNDFLWVAFLLGMVVFAAIGANCLRGTAGQIVASVSSGLFVYGLAYIFAHDGVAHGRFFVPRGIRRSKLFQAISRMHAHHHRGGLDGPGSAPFAVYCAESELHYGLNSDFVPRYRPCP